MAFGRALHNSHDSFDLKTCISGKKSNIALWLRASRKYLQWINLPYSFEERITGLDMKIKSILYVYTSEEPLKDQVLLKF